MHCASCGLNISKSLKKVEGVAEANVSVIMKSATIQVQDGVNQADLKKAVEKVGYKVLDIKEIK